MKPDWPALAAAVESAGGPKLDPGTPRPVGGGCINACYRVAGATGDCFVKLNDAARAGMFEAEADGLRALAAARAVRVPEVIAFGITGEAAWLALEWIELSSGCGDSGARMGAQLAALHSVTSERYGWEHDNWLGSSPQRNGWCRDWIEFFGTRRLAPQLDLAVANGFAEAGERGAQLLACLPEFFTGYRPEPALIHGDLWGGNWGTDRNGAPVLFDPAVHFADRESELAMTELFGGFPVSFGSAYRAAAPLDSGYEVRRDLYQLYHIINHLNLFGRGYLGRSQALIDRLLARQGQ